MANIKTFNEKSLVGIVVMAHGATVPYNTALEKVIKPEKKVSSRNGLWNGGFICNTRCYYNLRRERS